MSLYSNNQGLEGSFNYEKNHVSTHRGDMSSIPEFIHRRWNDNVEAGRLLSRQLSTSHSRIKKRGEKAKIVKVESEMKWKRTPGTIKAINGRWLDRMEAALNATRESGVDIPHHNLGKYREMSKHAIELDSNFASHMTFL